MVEDSEARTVDNEPSSYNIPQDLQEENIFNISASQQPSNLESLNIVGKEGASLSTHSPIHILGVNVAIPDLGLLGSPHADSASLVEVLVVLGEFILSSGGDASIFQSSWH